MDGERRESIKAALQQYRDTVFEHNYSLLRILVEETEAHPPTSTPRRTSTTPQKRSLDILERHFISIPDSVKSPRELLSDDIRDEVKSQLDGILPHKSDPITIVDGIFEALRAKIPDRIEVEWPPADLKYLYTLARSIHGSGFHMWRLTKQITFIDLDDCPPNHVFVVSAEDGNEGKDDEEKAKEPDRELADWEIEWAKEKVEKQKTNALAEVGFGLWEDWQILVGIQIGMSSQSGASWALYCREDDEEPYRWRYGINDEDCCEDLYDSVEEFLAFYSHFYEQTEEQVKKALQR